MGATMEMIEVLGGRVACDVAGTGPLVVLSPGMGDVRSSYRFQLDALVNAGYRAVAVDLRGHGDSDAAFTTYGDEATSADLVAVIAHFGGPAVIVGNSMSAGAAVLAAAREAHVVSGLVLVGPFVRDPRSSALRRLMMKVVMAKPFISASWSAYLPKLFAGRKPVDFDDYRQTVKKALSRPRYRAAFAATMTTGHASAEAALAKVSAPTMVVMGELDPDFPSPFDEAKWIGSMLSGRVEMIADAGHYPHAQQPEAFNALLLDFLAGAVPRG